MRHGKRKAGRHGGIHRIASGLQYIHAHLRGDLLLRSHHPVLGDDRVKPRVVSKRGGCRRVVRPLRAYRRWRGRERQQRGQCDSQSLSLEYYAHL